MQIYRFFVICCLLLISAKFAEPVSLGSVENPSLTLELSSVKGALDEESEAIAKAATQRQLCADDKFISRVLQLAHLVQTYQIVSHLHHDCRLTKVLKSCRYCYC